MIIGRERSMISRGSYFCIPENQFLRKGFIDRFTQYLRVQPNAWHLRYNLAVALTHDGRIDEALEQFRQVLNKNPKHLQTMINIGCIYLGRGDAAQALQIFTNTLAVWNIPLVRANLSVAYLQLGQFWEAIRHLKQTLALDPKLADAWTNLGSAYLRLNCLEKSISASFNALKLKPNLAMAHNNLGVAYLAFERIDEAKKYIILAKQHGYPVHLDLLTQLGL